MFKGYDSGYGSGICITPGPTSSLTELAIDTDTDVSLNSTKLSLSCPLASVPAVQQSGSVQKALN